MIPVDPETWKKVAQVLDNSAHRGLDPGEELNRRALLMTPEHKKKIQLAAMEYVQARVAEWRPIEFLRRRFRATDACTPADMLIVVNEYIDELIKEVRNQKP